MFADRPRRPLNSLAVERFNISSVITLATPHLCGSSNALEMPSLRKESAYLGDEGRGQCPRGDLHRLQRGRSGDAADPRIQLGSQAPRTVF